MAALRCLAPILVLASSVALADDRPVTRKPAGLEKRIPWNDSHVVGSPEPPSPYKVVRSFPGITITQPLCLFPEPGTNRLFILSHLNFWAGPTRLLAMDDNQQVSSTEMLLELSSLTVGLAFHPDYERNGYIFFGMNGPIGAAQKHTQVWRYTVNRKPPQRIDPASKRLIIEWPSSGHDGGDLAFGNDGTLFISSGDGSSGSDADVTGQTLDDLLAAVLRIDVDHPDPDRNYSVPKDNPFVNRPGARPEVWAYGLRNPWRMSYDRPSGQLWVGQNGQDLWEQVYLIQKGGNYGWSLVEGSHIFLATRKAGPDPILLPTAEHSHSEARSIAGGRVYRGKRLRDLVGAYVYGDWSTGRVWGIKHDGTKVLWHRELVDTPFNITGFGTDHAGEMYVIDHKGGFYRFEPTTDADRPTRPFPTKLSQTGLFASVAAHRPHPAAIRFDVCAPQWADWAVMERFAAFPGLGRIVQKPQLNAGGAWTLPEGSVLVQTLSLDVVNGAEKPVRKRVETRMLVRQQGEWTGYSYRWNPGQTDAELVGRDGAAVELEVADPADSSGRREQTWRFPSRTECLVCHSRAAGFVLAFSPLQLDRDHDFGGVKANQLRTYEHIGLFEGVVPARKNGVPPLIDPYNPSAPKEARVRSYLHVNCSICHVLEGGGNSNMQMDLATPLRRAHLIDVVPTHDKFDIADPRIVAPGSPERSVLLRRISRRTTGQMPPLVSTEVDHKAVELITQWIRGLKASQR
jgi:glucose/arabinose dehydrogenase